MNKINILRIINSELKYNPINDFIGIEMSIDISKKGEVIAEEIKLIIEENLKVKVKSIKGNNIVGTIAKYGLIDINYEIEEKPKSNESNGIQILRDNGWIDQENSDEYHDEGFFEDIVVELKENKSYLKIFANTTDDKKSWFKEKSYLLKQMMKGERIKPLPKDRIQVFKINDMCITNYSGIWLWKHFYM